MVQKHVAFAPRKMGPGPILLKASLSSGEKPCPLSLSHGFFTIQPSSSRESDAVGRRWGQALSYGMP